MKLILIIILALFKAI